MVSGESLILTHAILIFTRGNAQDLQRLPVEVRLSTALAVIHIHTCGEIHGFSCLVHSADYQG